MTKISKNFSQISLFLLLIFCAFALLFGSFGYAVTDGLNLWLACVVPALFPYLFITTLLSGINITKTISMRLSPVTSKVFRVNGMVGYAFITSVIAGYPIGAKTVADLRQNQLLSPTEAVRASAFCSTPSPMFLISSVGGIMFKNKIFGLFLFLANLLSAIIVGVIFSFYKRNEPATHGGKLTAVKSDNLLYDGVYSSVITVLCVGGLIAVFSVLTEILLTLNILTPFTKLLGLILDGNQSQGVIIGLFESTKGLKNLSQTVNLWSLPLCGFITAFGGISVIAQSVAYLQSAKIKIAPFILAKILSAIFCFLICLILSLSFF